jgi:hypothetical protein
MCTAKSTLFLARKMLWQMKTDKKRHLLDLYGFFSLQVLIYRHTAALHFDK